MKFVNIFLLFFQHVVNFRSRIFVWFLSSFLNPLSLLIFWIAVFKEKEGVLAGWSISSITSYYFLLIIAGSFIIAHIEEDVAIKDIREGQLVSYLLKPISYYWMKFFDEAPWRMIQGSFGIIVFMIFFILFSEFITLPNTLTGIVMAIAIVLLAFFISFTFKMIVGLSAFWFVDFWGLQQIIEVVIIILAGFVIPIEFFPDWLEKLSHLTPFPYMIYYPILSLQSKLPVLQGINVISVQIVWLGVLAVVYKLAWTRGIKKFTGVGQ